MNRLRTENKRLKFWSNPPLCSASFMFSHFSAKIDKSNQDKEGQEAVGIEGHDSYVSFKKGEL